GDGSVLEVLLEGEGGRWRRVLGDLDGDPTLVSHVVPLGVEHDGAGAVREIEGLADAIRVLTVVLRGRQHQEVAVVNAVGGVADERVRARQGLCRQAVPTGGYGGGANGDRLVVRARAADVAEAGRAPFVRIEIARARLRAGGRVEGVAERGLHEPASGRTGRIAHLATGAGSAGNATHAAAPVAGPAGGGRRAAA